ncbi:uncharacterized protein LOC126909750 [Daktulosphaira vitifoliae]|uniref:uncharacterized protein LOC126897091 n=1 Tax=Daktulosphaira vitifoliae TaxID=58002 RepID=UPI0021A98863|nr:uncharacterized protein LOC126897091 [Daktulosphaira vitifoliae]XP_050548138.1 uncharacterized protein LOC126909750 [Daktulosphaira vitifoliae]
MVSIKVILTLCIVSTAIIQVYSKPAEPQSDLLNQLEKSFKDLNNKIKDAMNSESVDMYKKKLNGYLDELNNNLKSYSKSFENSEFGKQANKQFSSAVEIYNRNAPADFSSQKVNEKLESAWKSTIEWFRKMTN